MDVKTRFSKVKGLVQDHKAAEVTERDRERMRRGGTGLQTKECSCINLVMSGAAKRSGQELGRGETRAEL